MKKMKRIAALLAATLMATALIAGCANNNSNTDTTTTAGNDTKVFKIGVIQLIQHPALDAAYEGFVKALRDNGYVNGENIEIDLQNASGDAAVCQTIADSFVNSKKDLILAIATDAALAAAMKTQDIPVLITAVTDPLDAGMVESLEMPGTNVSGTSDLTPVAEQMNLAKKIVPDLQKIALLYNSSEENSTVQANLAREAAKALGIETMDATVSNSNEIQQVVTSLAGQVQAIYAPTDNMIASGMPTVSMVAADLGLPVICGEENMVKAGGLITYGINYFDLGVQTGLMAVRVLEGEDISKMAIEYLPEEKLATTVNQTTADALGITIPEDILSSATIVE